MAADILAVAVDRRSNGGPADCTQDGSQCLGTTGRNDIAEHAARKSANDQSGRAIGAAAIETPIASAIEAVFARETALAIALIVAIIIFRIVSACTRVWPVPIIPSVALRIIAIVISPFIPVAVTVAVLAWRTRAQ